MDTDQKVYETAQLVANYAKSADLQVPEAKILARLRARLPDMDMLDLGVGGGRTSVHFAPLVKSYLGLDYSEAMIEACRKRLPGYRFDVADVRSMPFVKDGSFDFILFSYNGLDHVNAVERANCLQQLKAALRPGGVLVFSSHNTNFLPTVIDVYRFRIKASLRETLRSLKWASIFAWRNRGMPRPPAFTEGVVADGLHSFQSNGLYYIKPERQVEALSRLGLQDIACAGSNSGDFMSEGDPRIPAISSPWVYYICRKA